MEVSFSPTFYLRVQKRYGGRYVAHKRNRVLASGKTLRDLLKIMHTRKIAHKGGVIVGYVPSSTSSHVYVWGR